MLNWGGGLRCSIGGEGDGLRCADGEGGRWGGAGGAECFSECLFFFDSDERRVGPVIPVGYQP